MGCTKGHSLALLLLGMVSGQPCLIKADFKVLWHSVISLCIALSGLFQSHNSNRGQRQIHVLVLLASIGHSLADERGLAWGNSRKGEEDAVHNRAHADVPGKHVVEVHE